ncbi:MAG TPA: UbiA family prenyltransferase [Candidatus Aminicenantes bacterium]|nr:UbiA family prenyltransferase [Candidatus Aminicenantes bacterium]
MPEKRKSSLYLASLRLDRWPRSTAIAAGTAAVFLAEPERFPAGLNAGLGLRLLLAFILTWMASTANYIVNEITDAPYDAHHPRKKDRPLVAKEISVPVLLGVWALLTAAALGIAWHAFSAALVWSLGALLAAGILYNVPPLRVKDVPFLDSTLESANNPIRFLVGWYVLASSFPPLSLLAAWWAFGNFLMIGKRVAEKKFLSAEEAALYRRSLARCSSGALVAFMTANGLAFLAMFIVFSVRSGLGTFLYALPFIVFYLVIFMFKSIQDRDAAEEPEKQLRNPYFALYTLFLVAIFAIAFLLR